MKKPGAAPATDELRRQAEAQRRRRSAVASGEPADTQKLLHELQVQQVDLEMQNEGLRAAQAEIAAGLARYTDLYDLAPVAYLNLGSDGRIHQTNLLAASLLGIPRSQIKGKHLRTFVCPVALPIYDTFLSKIFAGVGTASCEVALAPAGNRPRVVVQIEAAADKAEQACAMVLFDITERKKTEEELQLAALVYQAVDEAIMVADTTNRIIAVNPAFTELTGYRAEEALGDRKSTRLNSSHIQKSRMPSSA